jgi:PadR family transcriptional regulator, regulatory protein AphA
VSLRAAILGFLDIEPTTGYSLRQRFEGSVASFWTVTQSQIYRELHALERERLVSVAVERGRGKPDRRVYALAAAGRQALAVWLHEPLEPLQLRHPLLLRLVFAAELEPARLDALLAQQQSALQATRVEYVERLAAIEIFGLARSPREATIWRLSIEHGIAWCDSEVAWLRRARQELGVVAAKARPRARKVSSIKRR